MNGYPPLLLYCPHRPPPCVLPRQDLHEQERHPAGEEEEEVGDEEGPAARLEAQVRETPDVALRGKQSGYSRNTGLL